MGWEKPALHGLQPKLSHTDTDTNHEPDTNADTNRNANTDRNTHPDTDANANHDSDTNADRNTNRDANDASCRGSGQCDHVWFIMVDLATAGDGNSP